MSKGVFIEGITVDMLRNASLEAVEDLLNEGDIVDMEVTPSEWIPCSERLPSKADHKDDMVLVCYGNGSIRFNTYMNGWAQGFPIAWMPLPEPYREDGEA